MTNQDAELVVKAESAASNLDMLGWDEEDDLNTDEGIYCCNETKGSGDGWLIVGGINTAGIIAAKILCFFSLLLRILFFKKKYFGDKIIKKNAVSFFLQFYYYFFCAHVTIFFLVFFVFIIQ